MKKNERTKQLLIGSGVDPKKLKNFERKHVLKIPKKLNRKKTMENKLNKQKNENGEEFFNVDSDEIVKIKLEEITPNES